MHILSTIQQAHVSGKKLFAVLLDPEKTALTDLRQRTFGADFVFVGGSTGTNTAPLVRQLHLQTATPVVLFPGNEQQFCPEADALLFLTVMSSDNPEVLIHRQIRAAREVKDSGIESIPTAYILIDGGIETAVARSTASRPVPQSDITRIVNTAIASELTGKQLLYLEAGSGAKIPVSIDIIRNVRQHVSLPLIVGGGIRSAAQMQAAFQAGADMVVVGNFLEQYPEKISQFSLN